MSSPLFFLLHSFVLVSIFLIKDEGKVKMKLKGTGSDSELNYFFFLFSFFPFGLDKYVK